MTENPTPYPVRVDASLDPSASRGLWLVNDEVYRLSALEPDRLVPQISELYERGIRRRLPTMLQGDRRRIELAYSLMITLSATSVWLGRNQTLYDFWFYITNFSRYPMEIYQGTIGSPLRVFFTYVLPVLVAKLVSILVSFVVNFSLSHFVVFKARPPKNQ